MSEQTEGRVQIAPQAALNESAALNEYYRNRALLLAQAVHDLTTTVEALRKELAETATALEAELAPKDEDPA